MNDDGAPRPRGQPAPAPAEVGGMVGGKYRLERLIARGGMGSVWEATHTQLDVRVAVKFMEPELASNPDARERFEREAKAAAHLRSPHVVQVLDYGVDGERPFIVMEKLEGQDLRARLRALGRMSLEQACRILNQACKALRLAADAGIVHRDLKPGNIFLCKSGDDEVVKILDFGVAKAGRGRIGEGTKSGMLLGSPHYMSPEQARGGRSIDHRSDLWSMAVILYQMLTGQKPFAGEDLGDVIVKICSDPVPVPSAVCPELPTSVDRFFARALDREPAARFQSAREMAASFQALVAQYLGIAESELSSSGMLAAPVAPGSKSGRRAADAPRAGVPAGGEAVTRVEPTPVPAPLASAEAGTLTHASGTIDPPMRRPSRAPWLALGAVLTLGAGGVVGWLAFGGATAARAPAAEAAPPSGPSAAEREAARADASATPAAAALGAPAPSASSATAPALAATAAVPALPSAATGPSAPAATAPGPGGGHAKGTSTGTSTTAGAATPTKTPHGPPNSTSTSTHPVLGI